MAPRMLLGLAWRHLAGQRRQSLLTMAGVALGVMVLLVISALMNGLLVSFRDTIVEAAPHLVITGREGGTRTAPRMLLPEGLPGTVVQLADRGEPSGRTDIAHHPQVVEAVSRLDGLSVVSPYVATQVIGATAAETAPVFARGVTPALADRVVGLSRRIREGSWAAFAADPGTVALGREAAKTLDVGPGERLRLIASGGQVLDGRVAAVFATGIKALDEQAFIHLKVAQRLEELPADHVTGLELRAQRLDQVDALRSTLEARTGLVVETWEQTNASIFTLFRIIGTITRMLVVFTILVAGFGVANVLVTVVLGKQKDISLLRSIGFTRDRVLGLFLIEGLLLGLGGALAGALLGFVACTLMGYIPAGGDNEFGDQKTLVMAQDAATYAGTMVLALLVCLVASVGPARRAAGLAPVDVLRGETT